MLRHSLLVNRLWICALVLLSAAPFSAAQAVPIPISSLLVNNASLTVAITGDGTYTFASPIVPPANIIMGIYQNPIAQFSTTTPSGTATATVYSAGVGTPSLPPPPSGSVDGSTITVNFSSLRASLNLPLYPTMDIPLWPLINPPTGGTYNASTGAYTLSWQDTFSFTVGSGPLAKTVSGMADVMLAGTATVVPLPAGVWLLGSGLLGIVAMVRRKRSVY